MAMDPLTLMAISAGLSGLGGMLSGGGGQEMESFGEDYVRARMDESLGELHNLRDMLWNKRVQAPIFRPDTLVQQPPVFVGGGLPMPIGVTGVDLAYNQPSLLGDFMDAQDAEDAMGALDLLLPEGAWRP